MKKQTVIPCFEPPHQPRIKRMHVIDAGYADGYDRAVMVKLECHRCGYQSEWIIVESVAVAKRGLPCPHCNKE